MKQLRFSIPLILILLTSCSKNNQGLETSINNQQSNWLVDTDDILYMNLEKDRIKSLDHPDFIEIRDSHVNDEEKVFVYQHNGIVHVYPLSAIQPHEIVNDSIGDHYFAITLCPLTASSLAWNRNINGEVTTFGVSGKLYLENLVPYDRNSGSHWSQILSLSINGEYIGETARTENLIETKFSTIKRAYPNALVLKHENCDSTSCGSGLRSTLEEPDGNDDNLEIGANNKYFGIVNDERAFLIPFTIMKNEISIIHTIVFQKQIIVVSSAAKEFIVSYEVNNKTFSPVSDSLPIIMKDNIGNYYDMFGLVISGTDKGLNLKSPTSFTALTFAWENFYREIEVMVQ